MKITIKTLKQEMFKVEVNETDTVKTLKEVIEKSKSKDTFPVGGQKLIYAGKILEDSKKLSEYNIEETKFVVAMVTKAKTSSTSEEPSSTPSQSTAPAPSVDSAPMETQSPAPAPEPEQPKPEQSETPATTTESTDTTTPSSTVPPESLFDERLNRLIADSLVPNGNGSFDVPLPPMPPLPTFEEFLSGVEPGTGAMANLEDSLPGDITPERLDELLVIIRQSGGIDSYLSTAHANPDSNISEVAAVQSLKDVANAMQKTIEEMVEILKQAHRSMVSGEPVNEPMPQQNLALQHVTGSDLENLISNIIGLGFSRSDVTAAMRASFNNPDRAVEYLMSGIPEGLAPPPAAGSGTDAVAATTAPLAPAAAPAAPAQSPTGQGAGRRGEGNVFDSIRNNEAFRTMAQQVRQNPSLLVSCMQLIGQQNPELLEYIREHQSEFIEFINTLDDTEPAAADDRTTYIRVTEAEKADIEQLKALGFPEHASVQAYMACEKNVELAANFLVNQNDENM